MYVNSLQVCLCVLLYHFYLLNTDIIRHTVPAECKLLSLGVSMVSETWYSNVLLTFAQVTGMLFKQGVIFE